MNPQIVLNRLSEKAIPEPNTGCWLWLGSLRHGYGKILVNGKTKQAHRVNFEFSVGSIPDGYVLRHVCRTPLCINPIHLEVVTRKESAQKGRAAEACAAFHRSKTHCPQGHEYSSDNIIWRARRGSNHRNCKACQKESDRKHREKRRAEDWRKFGEFLESTETADKRQLGPAKYYVYHLIDPFTQRVFYVGKGCGGRVFHHERDLLAGVYGNAKKEAVIRSIWNNGGEVEFAIVQRNLTEGRALWLEQAEIHRIGIENLTNRASASIPQQFRR